MSEERAAPTPSSNSPDIHDGRYLYCVVRVDDPKRAARFETEGVDDEPVSVTTVGWDPPDDSNDEPGPDSGESAGGESARRADSTVIADNGGPALGAVVHACDELYDSANPHVVRKWLVRHQRVVDAATERFGTPIPFQFDTILSGGDETLTDWLEAERSSFRRALEALRGNREYRIDVRRTEPIPTEVIVEEDDDLAELEREIEGATEGRAHLMGRQFEQRVAQRRRRRDDRLASAIREQLDPLVDRLEILDRTPSISLDGGSPDSDGTAGPGDGASDETSSGSPETGGDPVCRYAVLASEAEIDAVGSMLDSVADRDGITVRFTGPWPPYSFVPSIDTAGDDAED
ncbi:gas vesicle protein GvpL [Halovivax gelatinilyticus]|uniref:gas vesicle protein GvpL n=1 Tax=Halovivax gelatinilyticus TaxID=2961597 RepID=UPI0020CA7A3F|nr:GvpL/GvpF family gas vesicle protein [Halovivax gelatinilyticus]